MQKSSSLYFHNTYSSEQAKNAGHPEDAVNMLENYASDVELAVEAALNAHMWQQAIRMTAQHGRSDLNETHVKPALRESNLPDYLHY